MDDLGGTLMGYFLSFVLCVSQGTPDRVRLRPSRPSQPSANEIKEDASAKAVKEAIGELSPPVRWFSSGSV